MKKISWVFQGRTFALLSSSLVRARMWLFFGTISI